MSNPFDLAWSLLKGITQQDALEWAKHSQSQHEKNSEEWDAKQNHIDMLHNYGPNASFSSIFMNKKYGPPPAEYTELEVTPPEGYKPATPEQLERLTLEQVMNLPRINSNQE